jgi:hypothetical protein
MNATEKKMKKGAIRDLLISTHAAYTAVENIDTSIRHMWSHIDDEDTRLDSMEADPMTMRLERLSHELYRVYRELQVITMEAWP